MKLKYRDKAKTFYNDIDLNRFIGTHIPDMLHSQVTPELYYKCNRHEFWDDGTEMTGEEWFIVTTELLSKF